MASDSGKVQAPLTRRAASTAKRAEGHGAPTLLDRKGESASTSPWTGKAYAAASTGDRQAIGKAAQDALGKFVPAASDVVKDPLALLDGIQTIDDAVLTLPLNAGDYEFGGHKLRIRPGTVATFAVEVKDGGLVPTKPGGGTAIAITPPIDGALWVEGKGLVVRGGPDGKAEKVILDLRGWFDRKVAKLDRPTLRGLVNAISKPDDASGSLAQGTRAPSKSLAAGKSPKPDRNGFPVGMFNAEAMTYRARVAMKAGELDLGGTKVALAPGTAFALDGSGYNASLRGNVDLAGASVESRQLSFRATRGSGVLEVNSGVKDGRMEITGKLLGIEADVEQFSATRPDVPNDFIRFGNTAIRNGELEVTTRVDLPTGPAAAKQTPAKTTDTSYQLNFDAAGTLSSAHVTVKDARDTASLNLSTTPFSGRFELGRNTKVDLQLNEGDATIADLDVEEGTTEMRIRHAHVVGPIHLTTDTVNKAFAMTAPQARIQVTVEDLSAQEPAVAVALDRTELQGDAALSISSKTGISVDGDLQLAATIRSIDVCKRDGTQIVNIGEGSHLAGQLAHLQAGGGQPFELLATGNVNATLGVKNALAPGLEEVRGSGTFVGKTDLNIGPKGVYFEHAQSQLAMDIQDAKLAPRGGQLNLDVGTPSSLAGTVLGFSFPTGGDRATVELGPGSELDATLDSGTVKIGKQDLPLAAGSTTHMTVRALEVRPDGRVTARGSAEIRATVDAERLDRDALALNTGVRLAKDDAIAVLNVSSDDVELRPDGTFAVNNARYNLSAKLGSHATSNDPADDLAVASAGALLGQPPVTAPAIRAPSKIASATPPLPVLTNAPAKPVGYGLAIAERISAGNVALTIPLAGELRPLGIPLTVAPGSVVSATLAVDKGVIDFTKTKADSQVRGGTLSAVKQASFDTNGTLRVSVDLPGGKTVLIPLMENMPSTPGGVVAKFFAPSTNAPAGPDALSSQAGRLIQIPNVALGLTGARLKAGPLALPGGTLTLAANNELTMAGTIQQGSLFGHLNVSAADFAGKGGSLKAKGGEADLRVDWSTRDGATTFVTSITNLNIDAEEATGLRENGDFAQLRDGRISQGTLTATTTIPLGPDGLPKIPKEDEPAPPVEFSLRVPKFSGTVSSARATIPDADGTATIELVNSHVDGSVDIGSKAIDIHADIPNMDARLRNFSAGKSGTAGAAIDEARVVGRGTVGINSAGFYVDGQRVDFAAAARVRSNTRSAQTRATTTTRGTGSFRYDSTGELKLDGHLLIEGTGNLQSQTTGTNEVRILKRPSESPTP